MKRLLAILTAVLVAAGCLSLSAFAVPNAEPGVCAQCAIVMDAETGEVLYEKNADQQSLIASTTKIMTGWLICRDLDLEETISVPSEAVGVEGSSLYLREGEVLTGEELLYGLMLHSGNDAAVALAIACCGSQTAFVARMNRAAKALGLEHTAFANPHGLDSNGNYSTARDLAILTAAALRDETFRRVVSSKTVTVAGDRTLTNHNKLLWRCEGCIGVKTGYTRAAGRILVSACQRDGRTLICVTLNDPDDWDDHMVLYDYFLPAAEG